MKFQVILILFLFPFISFFAETGIQFDVESAASKAGYYQINWDNPKNETIALWLLTESEKQEPRLLYEGSGKSSFISGLPDGEYLLQIKQPGQDEPVIAESYLSVNHYSMKQATTFLVMGAILFLSICCFQYYWHTTSQNRGVHNG